MVNVNDMPFPLLLVRDEGEFAIIAEPSWLQIVYQPLVDRGYYTNGTYVSKNGSAYRITAIKCIKGYGWLWGYSLVRPRRMIAEVVMIECENPFTIEGLKQKILKMMHGGSTWSSRDDFDDLKQSVALADSFACLIDALHT